jgi:hypothetical protein
VAAPVDVFKLKRLRLGPSRWVVAVGGDVVSG